MGKYFSLLVLVFIAAFGQLVADASSGNRRSARQAGQQVPESANNSKKNKKTDTANAELGGASPIFFGFAAGGSTYRLGAESGSTAATTSSYLGFLSGFTFEYRLMKKLGIELDTFIVSNQVSNDRYINSFDHLQFPVIGRFYLTDRISLGLGPYIDHITGSVSRRGMDSTGEWESESTAFTPNELGLVETYVGAVASARVHYPLSSDLEIVAEARLLKSIFDTSSSADTSRSATEAQVFAGIRADARSIKTLFKQIGRKPDPIIEKREEKTNIAILLPLSDEEDRIADLKWPKVEFPIKRVTLKKTGSTEVTFLEGEFNKSDDWALLYNKMKIKVKNRKFKFPVELSGEATRITLVSIGPRGELYKEDIGITRKYLSVEARREVFKRNYFNVGIGYSYIRYLQNSSIGTFVAEDFIRTGLTFKASYLYLLEPRKWDFGANLFYTLIPLSSTSSKGHKPQFLGVNVRLGYVVPSVRDPWRLSLLGGIYYTTMIVSDDYGFTGLAGPQLFPVLRRSFDSKKSAFLYAKFSPISEGIFGFLDLKSREVALGGGFGWKLKSGHTITATVDASLLRIRLSSVSKITGNTITNNIDVNQVTVGAAYGF